MLFSHTSDSSENDEKPLLDDDDDIIVKSKSNSPYPKRATRQNSRLSTPKLKAKVKNFESHMARGFRYPPERCKQKIFCRTSYLFPDNHVFNKFTFIF